MPPDTEAAAVVTMSVASHLPLDACGALVDTVDGAAEARSLAVRMSSAGAALAAMVCSCAVPETRESVPMASCVEWLPSVGRRAELEPGLTVDVGASYPVSALSTPVSAGGVVSGGGEDSATELVLARSSAGPLAVLDPAADAELSVADEAWLVRLASPSPAHVLAAADAVVEPRSSPELPAPTIHAEVVPDAEGLDTSATRAVVDDVACPSPASVPPTASPDELRATAPAVVPIASSSAAHDTLELTELLATASSSAPPPSVAHAPSVDPTPA
jgi:hypothetical protein